MFENIKLVFEKYCGYLKFDVVLVKKINIF